MQIKAAKCSWGAGGVLLWVLSRPWGGSVQFYPLTVTQPIPCATSHLFAVSVIKLAHLSARTPARHQPVLVRGIFGAGADQLWMRSPCLLLCCGDDEWSWMSFSASPLKSLISVWASITFFPFLLLIWRQFNLLKKINTIAYEKRWYAETCAREGSLIFSCCHW